MAQRTALSMASRNATMTSRNATMTSRGTKMTSRGRERHADPPLAGPLPRGRSGQPRTDTKRVLFLSPNPRRKPAPRYSQQSLGAAALPQAAASGVSERRGRRPGREERLGSGEGGGEGGREREGPGAGAGRPRAYHRAALRSATSPSGRRHGRKRALRALSAPAADTAAIGWRRRAALRLAGAAGAGRDGRADAALIGWRGAGGSGGAGGRSGGPPRVRARAGLKGAGGPVRVPLWG